MISAVNKLHTSLPWFFGKLKLKRGYVCMLETLVAFPPVMGPNVCCEQIFSHEGEGVPLILHAPAFIKYSTL